MKKVLHVFEWAKFKNAIYITLGIKTEETNYLSVIKDFKVYIEDDPYVNFTYSWMRNS